MRRGAMVFTLLAAGWLAEALAGPDRDVARGVEALEAGDHQAALEAFEAAEARRGERPELEYDRGLALRALGRDEDAAKAFERGTESDDSQVRASAHYELGNAAFDAEQWDAAIESYTRCLRAMPSHDNAKWNLELALLRKQEEEKEQEEQQQDEQQQDEQQQDEQQQDEQSQDEQQQDEQSQDEQQQDEQQQDEQSQDEQQQAAPRELGEADLDKALEQLDAEDSFMLGRPRGRQRPVEKDW